jgi:TPR repeat protein
VAQEFTAAVECYRVAAGGGDRRAKFNLAAMYDNGRGVPRDLAAAEFWYGEAALEGDARAAYALGLMCETGAVRPPDSAAALSWYRKAWSRGVVAAGPKIARLERPQPVRGRKKAGLGCRGAEGCGRRTPRFHRPNRTTLPKSHENGGDRRTVGKRLWGSVSRRDWALDPCAALNAGHWLISSGQAGEIRQSEKISAEAGAV